MCISKNKRFKKFIIGLIKEFTHFLTKEIDDKKLKEIKEHHLYMIAKNISYYRGL